MQVEWQIDFTESFKHDFERLPRHLAHRLSDKLSFLWHDPYRPNPNAKPLKNSHGTHPRYRLRLGDYRVIYQILQKPRRVILTALQRRDKAYKKVLDDDTRIAGPLHTLIPTQKDDTAAERHNEPSQSEQEAFTAVEMPAGPVTNTNAVPPSASAPGTETERAAETKPVVEPIFLEEDDLALLRIPPEHHATILSAGNLSELESLNLPTDIAELITDYLTSPAQTHIGRLYSLDPGDAIESIASRPLGDFLLALDPQQRRVVEMPLERGPLLVRGGPGTGKSLIGLYRMRRLLRERSTESLFDTHRPLFRFLSYTNILVNTSKKMFESIAPGNTYDFVAKFYTFDKLVARGLEHFDIQLHPSLSGRRLEAFLDSQVLAPMKRGSEQEGAAASYVEDRLGLAFLMEEITELIEANGIETFEEYLAFQRRGRKTALQKTARKAVWTVYVRFRQQCEAGGQYTWAGKRLKFLKLLQTPPKSYPLADYLVMDEAQDMSVVALRTLPLLVRDPRNIMLLADSGQSIYNQVPSWKNISESLRFHRGNSIILLRSYRMTQELARALQPLRNDAELDPDDPIRDAHGVFTGEKPVWQTAPLEHHSEAAVRIAHNLVRRDRINAGQIAIILRSIYPREETHDKFIRPLEAVGLKAYIFNKNESLNLRCDSIHIITAHSAKGMEFPFVIVPQVSDSIYPLRTETDGPLAEESNQEWIENEQRLLYVALSRASYRLWMIADERKPSRFLKRLNPRDWQRERFRG